MIDLEDRHPIQLRDAQIRGCAARDGATMRIDQIARLRQHPAVERLRLARYTAWHRQAEATTDCF